jgi:UDP-N-acetylglucosamine 2-epimerase
MLAALMPGIADAIAAERPDWVLVYGDTNSTLGGARAATEAGIPLAHVEAGLRSYDDSMPEEHNRVETDRLSQLLFAPDARSRAILEGEGVAGRIEVVGDVMMDANLRLAPIARQRSSVLDTAGVRPLNYIVTTLHREANVVEPRLGRILQGLSRLELPVVFPAHPRTTAAIADRRGQTPDNVRFVPPLGYLDFAALASQARVIVTDSGGVQKEAYWYGVPCVTTRPSTEWVDTVEAGANVLVDDDPDRLVEAVANARMPQDRPQLYGDGHAAERIAAALYASRPE